MKMRRRKVLFLFIFMLNLCGCSSGREAEKPYTKNVEKEKSDAGNVAEIETRENNENKEDVEKGYHLPIRDVERREAESDCKQKMDLIAGIYRKSEKRSGFSEALPMETLEKMAAELKKAECIVKIEDAYCNMEHYEKFENFLKDCMAGKRGTALLYNIHWDGEIDREKYMFDGENIYVFAMGTAWNDENKASVSYVSHTRIKEWRYTENGWFCYKLCVPEYPEVTEMINGSCLIRVQPISKENRELSEKCLFEIGYQGNNLLCSDWNADNLKNLDYNGLYEYLYAMKYQKKLNAEKYVNGIPKQEFENLMMEYLPISAEKLQEYAVFDEETQRYAWQQLGCGNYAPTFFGTSVPEVVDRKENADGTVTLKVHAVCDMVLCDDAVITHELTVRFREDGSFQYLGNQILEDGLEQIPAYQYRITDIGGFGVMGEGDETRKSDEVS